MSVTASIACNRREPNPTAKRVTTRVRTSARLPLQKRDPTSFALRIVQKSRRRLERMCRKRGVNADRTGERGGRACSARRLARRSPPIEYGPIFDPLPRDFKRLDVPMAKQLWLTGLRGMTHMVPGFARGRTRGSSARSRDTRAKILAAACAVWLLAPPFAYAQFPFWPQRGFWPGQYGGHGHKHHHRHTKPELTKEARPEAPPTDPLEIIVSIADQRVSLYENGALVTRSPVSTGTK